MREGLGSLFHHLNIGYSLDCLVLLCELRALDNLWIAYDDAAWIEIIIESLALSEELRGEEEIELLHSFLGILLIQASGITNWDGTLDYHHCIRIHLQDQVDNFFYMSGVEEVLHWVVVRWCCNDYEVGIFVS